MNKQDIEKLREAAEAIAEIVKKHKAEGEEIDRALDALRDVVPPRIETVPNPYPAPGIPNVPQWWECAPQWVGDPPGETGALTERWRPWGYEVTSGGTGT